MTSPASAFGRLCNLNSKHFTKLKSDKPGLAVTLDKELQELCKDIDIQSFPATFSLDNKANLQSDIIIKGRSSLTTLNQK